MTTTDMRARDLAHAAADQELIALSRHVLNGRGLGTVQQLKAVRRKLIAAQAEAMKLTSNPDAVDLWASQALNKIDADSRCERCGRTLVSSDDNCAGCDFPYPDDFEGSWV